MTQTLDVPPEGYGILGRDLLIYNGDAAPVVYRLRPLSEYWREAYYRFASVLRLPRAPRLLLVRSTYGPAGFFQRGLIVLGQREVRRVVRLVHDSGLDCARYLRQVLRNDPRRSVTQQLRIETVFEVMLHELGHAAIAAGYRAPFANPEAAGDYTAGRISAVLERSPRFAVVLRAVTAFPGVMCNLDGLDGSGCYRRGYKDQMQRHECRLSFDAHASPAPLAVTTWAD